MKTRNYDTFIKKFICSCREYKSTEKSIADNIWVMKLFSTKHKKHYKTNHVLQYCSKTYLEPKHMITDSPTSTSWLKSWSETLTWTLAHRSRFRERLKYHIFWTEMHYICGNISWKIYDIVRKSHRTKMGQKNTNPMPFNISIQIYIPLLKFGNTYIHISISVSIKYLPLLLHETIYNITTISVNSVTLSNPLTKSTRNLEF